MNRESQYLLELLDNSRAAIHELIPHAMRQGFVDAAMIEAACQAEVHGALIKDQFYQLSPSSDRLLSALRQSPDANMETVVRKILKSAKLASHSFRAGERVEYVDQPLFPDEGPK